jgi:hypothetical protein
MLANVVNSLPAINSTSNRPRTISRRNPLTVIPPAGKAKRTTSNNRKGVSKVMPSGRRSMGWRSGAAGDEDDSTFLPVNLGIVFTKARSAILAVKTDRGAVH